MSIENWYLVVYYQWYMEIPSAVMTACYLVGVLGGNDIGVYSRRNHLSPQLDQPLCGIDTSWGDSLKT